MTILYVTRPPVKPKRHTPRKPAPFGEGLFPAGPRMPFTVADAEWAARTLNAGARDYNVIGQADDLYDAFLRRLEEENAALDALEAGLLPPDVAEGLVERSLIGHEG